MILPWFSVFLQALPGMVLGYSMDIMLPLRRNAPPRWVRVGIWGAVSLASAIYQVFFRDYSRENGVNILTFFLFFLAFLISARLFYRGKIIHKLAVYLLLSVALCSSEVVSGIVLWVLDISSLSMDYRQWDMAMLSFFGSITSNLMIILTALLWRWIRMQKKMPRGSWAVIAMQLCLFAPTELYTRRMIHGEGPVPLLYILAMGGVMLLNLVLIFIQFRQSEKEEAEQALVTLKQKQTQQRQYYESLEARREEMAKLRHDYNNHLSSILVLLRTGHHREAEAAVSDLLQKMENTQ